MKKVVVSIGLLVWGMTARAQQDPYYSHFKFNKLSYNPATAGEVDDYVCVTGLSHYQWRQYDDQTAVRGNEPDPNIGLQENVAPNTLAFNISAPISLGENPAQRNKLGVGLSFIRDEVAYELNTYANLALNYRLTLQHGLSYLAVGANIGMTQTGFPNNAWRVRQPGDPFVPTTTQSTGAFDFGAGVYYKSTSLGPIDNFYAGASVTHLPAPDIQIGGTNVMRKFVQHMYLVAGGDVPLNGSLVLEPAILLKYQTKPQIDLNATVLWQNMLRGGIGYRQWGTADAITVMLGYERDLGTVKGSSQPNRLRVGYSYDVTTSRIQQASNGTHEIFVGYCFQLPTAPPPQQKIRRTPRFL